MNASANLLPVLSARGLVLKENTERRRQQGEREGEGEGEGGRDRGRDREKLGE